MQSEEQRCNCGSLGTGMQLSVLGFGCGAVGGCGTRRSCRPGRTVARAIAAGVNYFDTAVQYGNSRSEEPWPCFAKAEAGNVTVGTRSGCRRRVRPHCGRRNDVARAV
jgi:aryl-alcohol dehydrogenase-like predicted oxidoreductase